MREGKYKSQEHTTRRGIYLSLSFMILTFYISFLVIGCANSVGDACIADSQCGTSQICDIRSPEGYCTVAECEEETCPGGSICVEFKNAQTYCMAECTQSDECRDGYKCIQIEDESLGETIGYCGHVD